MNKKAITPSHPQREVAAQNKRQGIGVIGWLIVSLALLFAVAVWITSAPRFEAYLDASMRHYECPTVRC